MKSSGKNTEQQPYWTIRRILSAVLLTLFIIAAAAWLSLVFFLKGPAPALGSVIISTMMETRRGKSLVHLVLSDQEISSRLEQNSISVSTEVSSVTDQAFDIPEAEKDDIQIIDIKGKTYIGKLMIIRDPSRISLGVNSMLDAGSALKGHAVQEYIDQQGGVAGINAGGFQDDNGLGDGSIPYGVVIKDGVIVSGSADDWGPVIGFNEQYHLIIGSMTGSEALSYGIRNAVTFGPALIVNYKAMPMSGEGSGVNPRTVIGQREDGAVLFLVIEGRQPESLGATYEDCIRIMVQYDAMNAANLDGGGCSMLMYQGQEQIRAVSLFGYDRNVPTAWVVK